MFLLTRTLTLLVILCASASSFAQISPGKLARAHEKLEGIANCTQCHELGQAVSPAKCLACHQALKSRIDAGTGYHSSGEVKSSTCAECHSEHNGREFELVHWKQGQKSFDHSLTGYQLEGAHRKADCRDCHKPAFISDVAIGTHDDANRERTFLGMGAACLNCHEDEHRDQLTDDCISCHTYEAWTPASKFAHEKTRYPLAGKHQNVDCAKCHALEPVAAFAGTKLAKTERAGTMARYSGLDFSNCMPCHKDPHENKFGQNCQTCHTTQSFQQIVGKAFDHNKTNYPLLGKHVSVICAKCHTSGNMTEPLAHDHCANCHKDIHRGQFTDRADKGLCESCHTVDGFKPAKYDVALHAQSRYPLTGSHLAVPCFVCHSAVEEKGASYARFDFADLTCKGCHKDPHQGQLDRWIAQGGCEYCHNTETWHRTTFDHKLSRFALVGKHQEKPCLSCHMVKQIGASDAVLWMKPIDVECFACHKDPHQNQFLKEGQANTDCARCHTPQGWKGLTFVHNRDAQFALDGAHAKVTCVECHKPQPGADGALVVLYRPLGKACADCHTTQRTDSGGVK